MIYLDWAASACTNTNIMDQSLDLAKKIYGNPSSIHYQGREAEKIISQSRQALADSLNCRESEIIFTSGGSEANNLALFSLLKQGQALERLKNKRIIISGIEHPALYKPAQSLKNFGIDVKVIKARNNGIVDPEAIEKALTPDTLLVSLMLVNNETGAIQPINQVAELLKQRSSGRRRILFHSDMVQALGKIPVDLDSLGVDLASFSAHKLGGPKGIGALYVKKGLQLEPLYQGGEQEMGLRPGTENLMGIHAFGLLARDLKNSGLFYQEAVEKMSALIQALKEILGLELLPQERSSESRDFSPYILKFAVPPVPGEVVVRILEEKGFLISTGSACSNKEQEKKYRILKNMGVPMELAASTLRVSLGDATEKKDLLDFAEVMKKEVPILQKLAGLF